MIKQKLKDLWNAVVDGFETAVWNVLLLGSGLVTYMDAVPGVKDLIPEPFAPWLMVLGVIGLTCRFLLTLDWIKKFDPAPEAE
jgi:hypothetical protein